ncbi:cytochrome P450 4C1-like [Diorhabda carinulata]|uniref:cytochrome P450 4C1-like n=1 Tax=Diorhabda carinulata TaxID=1163345 RepID=UPI0025A02654|nr:cytochrome P450 4C1-like [Diorhabda carinulata]
MTITDFFLNNSNIDSKSNLNASKYTEKSDHFIRLYLVVICCIFFFSWYVKWLWNRRYLYIHSRNVPGPFGLPFIGCVYLLFLHEKDDIMKAITDLQKIYPDIGALWFGTRLYYAVSKPEHIEKILTNSKALDKDFLYKFMTLAIGKGLLTAKVQKWRKHRKIIRQAFNQRILNFYQAVFLEKGEIFAKQLQKNVGNKDLDFFDMISKCTLDIICETAMGLNMNTQTQDSDVCYNINKMFEIINYRMFNPWYHLEFIWKLNPLSKQYDKAVKIFKNFTSTVINKKQEAYNNKQNLKDSIPISGIEETIKGKIAFLDLILENTNFTEKELQEEVELFLLAGTDTTATALSCIFTLLGMFQDVQQNVLEEILAILGPDRPVSPSDLSELKYTERVIKESLRLFPVAALFGRNITEDIDAGDIVFPAGSSVFFCTLHIQRNPKYWPDPLKFDPDRFLPENVAKRHPCTYIPFSYGPRNCIGAQYAMINMKTILATILRRFRIYTSYKTIEEIELKINLLLRMKEGSKVWVEAR